MLNRFHVNPILPAQDGDRARKFYRDVLGLDLLTGPTDDPMVFGAASGSSIALTELPDRVPAALSNDQLHGRRHRSLVKELKARGATFQPPGAGSFAGVEGQAEGEVMDFGAVKSAFLKDTEGNVIALNEMMGWPPHE